MERINEERTEIESLNPYSEDYDEEEDASSDNPEVKQFIQDNNSQDGCARYHDIYVRAISTNPEHKLFIFIKNYSYDSFKPMF